MLIWHPNKDNLQSLSQCQFYPRPVPGPKELRKNHYGIFHWGNPIHRKHTAPCTSLAQRLIAGRRYQKPVFVYKRNPCHHAAPNGSSSLEPILHAPYANPDRASIRLLPFSQNFRDLLTLSTLPSCLGYRITLDITPCTLHSQDPSPL